jgi:hypothetical protein
MNFEHEWVEWNGNIGHGIQRTDTGIGNKAVMEFMVFSFTWVTVIGIVADSRHGDGMSELCLSSLFFFFYLESFLSVDGDNV